jgi:hypothetical protein
MKKAHRSTSLGSAAKPTVRADLPLAEFLASNDGTNNVTYVLDVAGTAGCKVTVESIKKLPQYNVARRRRQGSRSL